MTTPDYAALADRLMSRANNANTADDSNFFYACECALRAAAKMQRENAALRERLEWLEAAEKALDAAYPILEMEHPNSKAFDILESYWEKKFAMKKTAAQGGEEEGK